MKRHAAAMFLVGGCLAGCATTDLSDLPDPPSGRSVSVGGESIFVRQSGAGPDIVLLHGLGDSSLGWQFLEGPLVESGYRVTVWDALGAGRSAKPRDGDYSLVAHLRRLEGVLDQLAIERVHLVGHSLGGYLSLAQANSPCVQCLSGSRRLHSCERREGTLLLAYVGLLIVEQLRDERGCFFFVAASQQIACFGTQVCVV